MARVVKEGQRRVVIGVITIGISVLIGCGVHKPRPLNLGEDQCAYCAMVVSDPKFGAELITTTGKLYVFDAIECLAAFVYTRRVPADRVQSLWVADFERVEKFVPAESAFYVYSPRIRSPMGMSLLAVATEARALVLSQKYDGQILHWEQVVDRVVQQWKLKRK